jgi:amidase
MIIRTSTEEKCAMPTVIKRDRVFFAFSPDLQPTVHIQQGEEFIMETHDCFEGQLRSEADLVESLAWEHVNPATGPVYILDARPGDILRVDLLEINLAEKATMVTIPGEGVLGDVITEMETSLLDLRGGKVVFKNKVEIPIQPMVGVIGVAPAKGSIPNGTPGDHGGNMDCTLIGDRASVYFKVGVDGALFGCGDLHAVMGDGEIVVCGAEIGGKVRLKAQVVPLVGLPTPFIETDTLVATVSSAKTADEAGVAATHAMARFLTDFARIPLNDAGMLMSLVGSLKFCQVVDPEKTVRFEFPKAILKEYGYQLPR